MKCDVCHGSGINPDYRSKSCRNCWNTIEYSARTDSSKVPDLCPSCREKARNEKNREREARQHQPRREERPRFEQRPRQDDKWQEKSCPGLKGESGCSSRNTIRYRTDWNRIPDLCPECIAKIKAKQAERNANTLTGRCEKCGGETRYDRSRKPPRFCKKCNDERQANKRTKACPYCSKEIVWYVGEREFDCCFECSGKRNRNRVDKMLGEYDLLPGSDRTPHDLGCTHAHIRGLNPYGGIHVTVYSKTLSEHEHVSWDTDIDGNYQPRTTHETEEMSRHLRKMNFNRT